MAKIKFTAGRINSFQSEIGRAQTLYWDSDAPGFGVRVTDTAKAFIFQGKLAGQTIRIKIGDVRAWGIDDARNEARRMLALVNQGRDPRQERIERTEADLRKREEAKQEAAPAHEAWSTYLEARKSRWSERSFLDHQRLADAGGKVKTRGKKKGEGDTTLPGLLVPLLQLPLAEIDADQVRDWLKREAEHRPTQANNAFVRLRAFLNWCADRPEYRGIVHIDACATRIVRDELPKKKAKDDCLQREQLPLWFEHVRKLPNPVHSAYLQALLLTGARREELASLKWDDVDFQWRSMTIRDKVDGERTIPLTPYVTSLLAILPRRNEWVFSSPTAASGRIQEPRIGHNKAMVTAGLPPLTLHGLRRSFGTLAEWVECPAGVSAQIMGHKPSATAEKHYRVRPLDLLRMWHTKIEAWVLEQAGIEQPAESAKPGLKTVQTIRND